MGYLDNLNKRLRNLLILGLTCWLIVTLFIAYTWIPTSNSTNINTNVATSALINRLPIISLVLSVFLSGSSILIATLSFASTNERQSLSEIHRILNDFYIPLKLLIEDIRDTKFNINKDYKDRIKKIEPYKYLAENDTRDIFRDWNMEFIKKTSLCDQQKIDFSRRTEQLYSCLCDDIESYENQFKVQLKPTKKPWWRFW